MQNNQKKRRKSLPEGRGTEGRRNGRKKRRNKGRNEVKERGRREVEELGGGQGGREKKRGRKMVAAMFYKKPNLAPTQGRLGGSQVL